MRFQCRHLHAQPESATPAFQRSLRAFSSAKAARLTLEVQPNVQTSRSTTPSRIALRRSRALQVSASTAVLHAASSVEVPIKAHFAQGSRIEDYLRLPVSQYVLIGLPMGGQLRRISDDIFELTVPQLSFFGVWVQPLILCQVRRVPDGPAVDIKSVDWHIRGSQLVQEMNLRQTVKFDVQCYLTHSSPSGNGSGKAINTWANIDVLVDVPPFLALLPTPITETSANAVLQASLSTLLRSFVVSLADDYNRWGSDPYYREARAQYVAQPASA